MKTIFDNKAASADAADQKLESTIGAIMEVFSMILHKGYKINPDVLAYAFDKSGTDYLFSFCHSAAPDMHDPAFIENFDGEYYRAMRAFLRELYDLDPDLAILPDQLALGAPNLLSLVDTLDLYFKQENCPLTSADSAVTGLSAQGAQVADALRRLAKDGYDLARDKRDAYAYYLTSAPHRPFVSLDHYYAAIAARAKADVPVSIDLLRKDVLSLEPAIGTISAGEQSFLLKDSFRNCAEWHKDAPESPQTEHGFFLLTKEMQDQFASAIRGMLIINYGLSREMSEGTIALSVNPVTSTSFDIELACPVMPDEKTFGRFVSTFHEFGKNFRKAGERLECLEGVELLPVRGNTLMLIRYSPSALFSVITHMAAHQHPGNLLTQAHLLSIVHIKERLKLDVPPNALN